MGNAHKRASVELRGEPFEIPHARRFVAATLVDWQLDSLVSEAELLTSETVTNAIMHGEEPIELPVTHLGDRLRVAVRDDSSEMPTRFGLPDRYSTGGRGVAIVQAIAADFGITTVEHQGPRPDSKDVWFEISIPAEQG